MSDLKITDGDDTDSFQLDAALAREAALREELAQNKSDIKDLTIAYDVRDEALQAAEQRNTILTAHLIKARGLLEEGQRLAKKDGSSLWEVVEEFLALTKPTESGVRE